VLREVCLESKNCSNAHTLSAGKNSTVPGLRKLIVEARAVFGGFWRKSEPWFGRSEVRVLSSFSFFTFSSFLFLTLTTFLFSLLSFNSFILLYLPY
jgi:hypothetical protein